jgi:hypothetical protein
MGKRRQIDDLTRLLAVVICLIPVATFCTLYIMSFTFAKLGIAPPPLGEVKDGLRDIVLMVIGAAAGLAFGTYSSANAQRAANRDDPETIEPETK